MNPVRWKGQKYLRFAPSDDKDMGIRKFEFVTKTQYSINKTAERIGLNFVRA